MYDVCSLHHNALAYGTCARSAHGSQNCTTLSIIVPFIGNGAFLCANDVVVDLPCRKDATKVFFREVNTNKYIINAVVTSSYTRFENIILNSF